MIAAGQSAKKTPFGVTPKARPWQGGDGQDRGNHGARIALTAHHTAEETAGGEAA